LSGLRVIAKNLGAENPDAEAEKTKNRLLRHIANRKLHVFAISATTPVLLLGEA
jgi:hypothetical protein